MNSLPRWFGRKREKVKTTVTRPTAAPLLAFADETSSWWRVLFIKF
jgi:hypothetical protein